MQNPIETLFAYAQTERIPIYLVGEEYEEHLRVLEQQKAHLRSVLPPDELRRLEDYFSEAEYKVGVDMEAAFRAGFSMALDLVRA